MKPYMGLTSWENAPEGKVVKTDVTIAKNYLAPEELESLGRIVNAYLELAEDRAKRCIPMTMEDWAKRLDKFLEFDEREVLQNFGSNFGSISAKIAKDHAESEFEKYRVIQDRLFESDFDKEIKLLAHHIDKNKEKIDVRSYKQEDARSLIDIFYNTIHKVNSRDYTEEQINSWAPESFLELEGWTKKWEKLTPFVAEINNQVVGFAEFEDTGYIDCFYVHHEFQGQGIGGALLASIYQVAKAKNIEKIWADVSITAKPFFEKNGFIVIKEQLIEKRGSTLKNYKMEKNI